MCEARAQLTGDAGRGLVALGKPQHQHGFKQHEIGHTQRSIKNACARTTIEAAMEDMTFPLWGRPNFDTVKKSASSCA